MPHGDGTFSSMVEIAEQKFLTAFSLAYQTFQTRNFGVAVFGIGAAYIRWVGWKVLNKMVGETKALLTGHISSHKLSKTVRVDPSPVQKRGISVATTISAEQCWRFPLLEGER